MAGSKLPFAPDDVRGRQMGNYEVLCRLSTGGMAEILLATRRGLAGFHKPVVLKKILPDIQGQEEFVQMFLDEARVTAAFNHPNIAQVFDLDVANDELFLTMEFVPGATLLEVARACHAANEPMPMGLALAAARDTALALHYAHTFTDALGQPSPVIHRDVAEKNIMVTYEGVTKLLDFGIAKSLAGASRTQVGMVKGTSGYMSPEQILGEPLDARSDLFSLGVVLHECLTGMRLFPGKAPAAVCNAVLKGPIPEPSRTNKAVPPELDALVLKALARKRDERHASTLEFARELERAVAPLIWLPEQSGELLRRLFAERREQTRQLLASGRATTGEVKLAQPFSEKEAPAPQRLPTISAPLFPAPGQAVLSEQTDIVSYSLVTKPPAPLPSPGSPPPPPPEDTNVQRPAQLTARARPARVVAEAPSVSAPPVPDPPRASVRLPTPEPAHPRARSLSRTDALPPPVPPEPESREPELKTAVIRPQRTTPTGEQPVTSDDTVPRYNPTRPARRASLAHLDAVTIPIGRALESPSAAPASTTPDATEAPTRPSLRSPLTRPRPVEPEDDGPEFPTQPSLTLPSREEGHMPLRGVDEASPSPSRGRGTRVAALLLVLLLGGAATLVALRLDGGLLSSRLFPPPPDVPAPAVRQDAPPPAPADTQAPSTHTGDAPPPTPESQPPAEAPQPPAGSTTPEPAAVALAAPTTAEAPPPSGAPPTDVAPDTVKDEEPAQPAKRGKVPAGPRRKRSATTAATMETSPELVTNSNEAERAWQALERERSGAANPSGDKGFLTLATDQYVTVYRGSERLGDTPLFRVPLPPGKHTLRLVGDGRSLRIQVEIKTGEVTSIRGPLSKLSRE
ncbi:protein kinase [Archangium violaceum]|uniref:serine/threonine-protein kinase n=1 Tax=Archangium violaceum TaxID=83451 RepID=UPI00193C3939|nr:serine/threonine-protein kinase [Archangium violaceum]QRK11045.1 protein kinase [Archangium violaceum]